MKKIIPVLLGGLILNLGVVPAALGVWPEPTSLEKSETLSAKQRQMYQALRPVTERLEKDERQLADIVEQLRQDEKRIRELTEIGEKNAPKENQDGHSLH